MIYSLTIQNYRVFKKFSLDQISRVNLIVGTNNSGKSSLLEAIYLLTSEKPSLSLVYVLSERGEFTTPANEAGIPQRLRGGGYLLSHIFNRHNLEDHQAITISSNSNEKLSLTIAVIDAQPRVDEMTSQSLSDDVEVLEIASRSKRLVFEHDSYRENILISDSLIPFRGYRRRITTPVQNTRLVTTNFLSYDDLSLLWDNITLTPREEKVVEALQIIEPKAERINFTSRQSLNSGVLLKLRGEKNPMPLSSMGDGMRRILTIAVSLVSVDAGTLLVDEIDTGLHYTALTNMWRLILETSVNSNAQVFATTHSWDCVRAFQQALTEVPNRDVGRLIRLDREDDHIKAVDYVASELDIAVKQDIEVR